MDLKLDRDKQKFLNFLEKSLKSTQKQILDLAEVAAPQQGWKALRSKILGATNDFRREIEEEIDRNYKIKFDPQVTYEDIVIIKNKV